MRVNWSYKSKANALNGSKTMSSCAFPSIALVNICLLPSSSNDDKY